MKILVTGANGFLGREIVRQLITAGIQVRATDRQTASFSPNLDYHHADILDSANFQPVVHGVDYVIHAAGLAHLFSNNRALLASFEVINEIGTANVARSSAKSGVKHFVLISSVSVYGGSRNGGGEDSGCFPKGPYAISKYQAEQRATEIAKVSGMALTILRLATLYGEGDPGNVARLMRAIDSGRFVWVGNGMNRKSLLYRADAARACLEVIRCPASGVNIYNVSTPPYTMREVVEGLASAFGKRIPTIGIPASLISGISGILLKFPLSKAHTLGTTARKWLADDVYDGSKLERTFNFQPKVSLIEGLRREVAWYREFTKNKS